MNRIYQLQSVLNFFLWLTIILVAASCAIIFYAILGGELFDIRLADVASKHLTPEMIAAGAVGILGHLAFIIALLKMRVLVKLFVARKFFESETIAVLNKIGKLLFAAVLMIHIPKYVLPIFSTSHIRIVLSADHEAFLFLLVISLFFFTLGYIFEEAKKIKEENELTV